MRGGGGINTGYTTFVTSKASLTKEVVFHKRYYCIYVFNR